MEQLSHSDKPPGTANKCKRSCPWFKIKQSQLIEATLSKWRFGRWVVLFCLRLCFPGAQRGTSGSWHDAESNQLQGCIPRMCLRDDGRSLRWSPHLSVPLCPASDPGQSAWVPENTWGGENFLYPMSCCSLAMTLFHGLSILLSSSQLLPGSWWPEAARDAARRAAACSLAGPRSAPASSAAVNARSGRHKAAWTTSILPVLYKDQNDNNKAHSTSLWFLSKYLHFTEKYPHLPFFPQSTLVLSFLPFLLSVQNFSSQRLAPCTEYNYPWLLLLPSAKEKPRLR